VCDLGQALIDGVCTDCPDGEVPSESGDGCKPCPEGQIPTQSGDECEAGVGNPLPDVCDLGEALINGSCTSCPEGQVPTQSGDGCEDPLDPDFGNCPSGQFLNETTGDCQTRPPLLSPGNPLPPTCDLGEALINNKCTNCTEGQVPNESGDGCEPLDPEFGQCPSGIKDEATGECITCKPNEYLRPPDSTNGEKWTCQACPPYQAPYPDKTGCEKCSDNGKVPSEDGSECVDLDPDFGMCPSGIKDEATGECVTCEPNQYPNPDKGQCEDCPEGQVPNESGDCKPEKGQGKWCVIPCWEGVTESGGGKQCEPHSKHPEGCTDAWCNDGHCENAAGAVTNACSADGDLKSWNRCQLCSTINDDRPQCPYPPIDPSSSLEGLNATDALNDKALNGTSSDDGTSGKDCKDPRGCDEDTAETETAGTVEMPTLPGGEKNDNEGDQTPSAGTMDLPDPKDDPKDKDNDKDKASAGTLNLGAPSLPGSGASGSGDAEEESGLLG